jgi:hypothetical protein
MLIPRFWERTRGEATDPEGKRYALTIWGWSQESVSEALGVAERRLRESVARITRGEAGGDYAYGRNPLREEIVREIGDGGGATITRNRYGALVLNTATFAFIDIDTEESGPGLSKLFGFFRKSSEDPALVRIREACAANNRYSYRIYRTRRGFRLLVTTASLDPKSSATEALLKAFGADPAFTTLCRIQGSFRARLTPKPWRVDCPLPPGQHPRDPGAGRDFDLWRARYEAASKGFATCQFVEGIGAARPSTEGLVLVELHDRETKAASGLPLA